VKNLLSRYIRLSTDSEYTKKEEFLQEKLGLPAEWIHQAKVSWQFEIGQCLYK